MWVAGTAITLVVVILCGAVLWYVSRAVANRIAHLRHGNTAAPEARLSQLLGSEATFEVASTKKGVTHKVWVHLKEETAACGCRAYLAEGRCGHCDAAMDTARSLGFLHAAQRGAGPALTDSIRSTASDALAKGRVVLGLGNSEGCFSQLAAKSRGLSCFQGLAGRDLAAAPADGASAAHAQSGSVQRAATATVARTPSRRNKGPVPARSSPVIEAEFLAVGSSSVDLLSASPASAVLRAFAPNANILLKMQWGPRPFTNAWPWKHEGLVLQFHTAFAVLHSRECVGGPFSWVLCSAGSGQLCRSEVVHRLPLRKASLTWLRHPALKSIWNVLLRCL